MKTPETVNPFRVFVNGVEKVYEAGAEVSDESTVDILSRMNFPPAAPAAGMPFVPPAPEKEEPFVVTLTPTEEDLSGTMDKTAAEITAAYDAGRNIVLSIDASLFGFTEMKVLSTIATKASGQDGRVCLQGLVVFLGDSDLLIYIRTGDASDDAADYDTNLYVLTPVTQSPTE